MMTSTTQSLIGLSSLIFVMKINSFVIQPNKLWTKFEKCLPPYLHDNRVHGPPYRGLNQNKQQDYNEENNEDEKYTERVLGNHRGPTRD